MNVIEFSSHKEYVESEEELPVPIRLNIPKWYKDLTNHVLNPSIKACMPF